LSGNFAPLKGRKRIPIRGGAARTGDCSSDRRYGLTCGKRGAAPCHVFDSHACARDPGRGVAASNTVTPQPTPAEIPMSSTSPKGGRPNPCARHRASRRVCNTACPPALLQNGNGVTGGRRRRFGPMVRGNHAAAGPGALPAAPDPWSGGFPAALFLRAPF
jgi:hypothetical protein